MTLARFNQLEALVWFGLAGVLLLRLAFRGKNPELDVPWIAIPTLVVFGVSDLIEGQTGAWWRPWPLLALKAGSVMVLAGCFFAALRGGGPRGE